MTVSKNSMINGLSKYITEEVAAVVPKTNLKFVVSFIVSALKSNSDIVDRLLSNEWVKSLLPEEDGMYDTSMLEQVLHDAMSDCDKLEITIPSIPIILPDEQTLVFRQNDLDNMFRYIKSEVN